MVCWNCHSKLRGPTSVGEYLLYFFFVNLLLLVHGQWENEHCHLQNRMALQQGAARYPKRIHSTAVPPRRHLALSTILHDLNCVEENLLYHYYVCCNPSRCGWLGYVLNTFRDLPEAFKNSAFSITIYTIASLIFP